MRVLPALWTAPQHPASGNSRARMLGIAGNAPPNAKCIYCDKFNIA